jgi:signal transduction histidine kinase
MPAAPLLRLTPARLSPPTRRSLLKGLLAFRWATAGWAVALFTGVQLARRHGARPVAHPVAGYGLVASAVVCTALLSLAYRRRPDQLVRPGPVLGEAALGALLLLADNWVYGTSAKPQTLPSIWVVGAVGAVAVAGGRRAAVVTGVGLGLARLVGLLPYGSRGGAVLTGSTTVSLLALTGWVMGYLLYRLAEADRSIATFRAREEVARTLHDGVLQTLAVIQRRSADDELVALARSQEHELREYLFGRPDPASDLPAGLRAAGRRAEDRYGLAVRVVIAPDLPAVGGEVSRRMAAAVGEALTNAAKHGGAAGATVYAEPAADGGVFVSVKDDGCGFDSGVTPEGEGLTRSVRGRLAEVGGRVEVDGRPGRGTEIRMWT